MNGKRIGEYILGLLAMAFGIVLMKKAKLGITPITSLPLALNEVFPQLTLGNWTILFHVVCIIAILAILRRPDLKTFLMLPMGIAFGYVIDFMLWLWSYETDSLAVRVALLVIGIPFSGLGVALINDADLMLPSPDGLSRTIATHYNLKYPVVKITMDCFWVGVSIIIELAIFHKLTAVGVGTVAGALLIGRAIGVWNRILFSKKAEQAKK